ncbi:restriction endonuclease [Paraburkholderia sp.]|uniref:restriction endonuclease n=1 Tax=Paraburkholderia sp. TaxID=1926495 RepID=UPI0039E6DE58
MNPLGFMHKYYDWAAFETFVRDLYDGDGDVIVERDVNEVDRYGAKRQTDIKITRRSRFHRYITLVECKRWKEPVSRDRIDVLASSIEALNASNGAIFTTTGFEEGAIAYAKGKGIDLFVVRDLTDHEWGSPGRHVTVHLHIDSAQFNNIQLAAQAVMLVDGPPGNVNLAIDLSKEKVLDPDLDLFSVKTGERGPNLVGILADAHSMLLQALGNSIGLLDGGKSMALEITAPCELDLGRTEFHQLRLPMAAVRVERIGFQFCARVSQSTIEIDRGKDLDFAVVVESYVSDHRLVAHRKAGSPNITFLDLSRSQQDSPPAEDAFQNGSLLRVFCAPWVGNESAKPDKTGATGQLIKVCVETDGKKPQLSLIATPLSNTNSAAIKPDAI